MISLLGYSQKEVLEFTPSQSMCITGKGLGQDAAINPYTNEKSIAVIKNIGANSLEAWVQKEGEIIFLKEINDKETEEVILEVGYEQYIDTELGSKAKVKFKKPKD